MQQFVQDGQSGLNAKGAINGNFSELYGAVSLPKKLPNTAANAELPIVANSFVGYLLIKRVTGNPIIMIGTQAGGEEILPQQAIDINKAKIVNVEEVFEDPGTLYFTLAGGSVNISVFVLNNVL